MAHDEHPADLERRIHYLETELVQGKLLIALVVCIAVAALAIPPLGDFFGDVWRAWVCKVAVCK